MPFKYINDSFGASNHDGTASVNKFGDRTEISADVSLYGGDIVASSGDFIDRFDDYGLRRRTYEVGSWNMSTTSNAKVNHGLGTAGKFKKIRSAELIINNDSESAFFDAGSTVGVSGLNDVSISGINNSQVILRRRDWGFFDSADFASTAVNRGHVTLWYV